MDCPRCKGKSKVLDSRTQPDSSTRRKRKCLTCGTGYWTLERLASDWQKKSVNMTVMTDMTPTTPAKQPQTTQQKKVVQRAAAKPLKNKSFDIMTDEELEEAIYNGEYYEPDQL